MDEFRVGDEVVSLVDGRDSVGDPFSPGDAGRIAWLGKRSAVVAFGECTCCSAWDVFKRGEIGVIPEGVDYPPERNGCAS